MDRRNFPGRSKHPKVFLAPNTTGFVGQHPTSSICTSWVVFYSPNGDLMVMNPMLEIKKSPEKQTQVDQNPTQTKVNMMSNPEKPWENCGFVLRVHGAWRYIQLSPFATLLWSLYPKPTESLVVFKHDKKAQIYMLYIITTWKPKRFMQQCNCQTRDQTPLVKE